MKLLLARVGSEEAGPDPQGVHRLPVEDRGVGIFTLTLRVGLAKMNCKLANVDESELGWE